jgi:hypothetical protein
MFKCDGCGGIAGNDHRLDATLNQFVAELLGKPAHLGIAPRAVRMTSAIADVNRGLSWEARLHLSENGKAAYS